MRYLALLLLPFLFACEEHYRYPCQDPHNWNDESCKKPYCSANGTCPEDLTHYEKAKVGQPSSTQQLQPLPQVPSKGDCK